MTPLYIAQEKQDLLKAFVNSGENLDNIEMQLVVARTSEGEVEHQRALLTIREMKEKGFSQQLGILVGCFGFQIPIGVSYMLCCFSPVPTSSIKSTF